MSYLTTGCKHGFYGRDCKYYCSGNCLHNVPCNSTDGHCDSGCASGYLNVFCNKSKTLFIVSLLHFVTTQQKKSMEISRESYSVKLFACNFYNSIKRQIK